MIAELRPLDDGPPIAITKDLTLIGRRKECDIRLAHKAISKYHCVLAKTSGLLLLRDLCSTNGTRVNGRRVRRAALLPNDKLRIGQFHFKVFFGPDEQVVAHHDVTLPLEAGEIEKVSAAHAGEQADVEVNGTGDDISDLLKRFHELGDMEERKS